MALGKIIGSRWVLVGDGPRLSMGLKHHGGCGWHKRLMDDGSGKGEKIKQQLALHFIILPRHMQCLSRLVSVLVQSIMQGRMLHLELSRIPRLYGCAGIVSHLVR